MRAVASYAAGILMLGMMLASGGAWALTPESKLVPVQLNTAAVQLPYAGDLPPSQEVPAWRSLPPGCRLGYFGPTCAAAVVAGGAAVAESPRDLVPQQVTSIADWRPLVARFFDPAHVDRALRIMSCESNGRVWAKNPRSTASGLFQHLGSLWATRSAAAGWAGSDVFDPVANVAVAAWLVYDNGGWSHWNASAGCWR